MRKGQRKTQDPCEVCRLHKDRCICELIPKLNLQTKVSLVIHTRELKRTTNTGTLALKALMNSQMLVRGRPNEPLDLTCLLNSNYQSVLFYPSKDAVALTPEFVQGFSLPIQLIVPDGNWRQASKIHYRHPELKELPRVMIQTINTSQHHLRAESTPEGMATLQAIAHALGVIEGDSVKKILLELYEKKLNATLKGRGILVE